MMNLLHVAERLRVRHVVLFRTELFPIEAPTINGIDIRTNDADLGIAAALLSDDIAEGYFFRHDETGTLRPVATYLGDQIRKYVIVDLPPGCTPIGSWRNSEDQRRELLEFPAERVRWDDATEQLSRNVALFKPSHQSSVLSPTTHAVASGGNDGRITGGFGFHTDLRA